MAQGKLDAVGLIVSDLARSVKFYRHLGAPFAEGAEDSELTSSLVRRHRKHKDHHYENRRGDDGLGQEFIGGEPRGVRADARDEARGLHHHDRAHGALDFSLDGVQFSVGRELYHHGHGLWLKQRGVLQTR